MKRFICIVLASVMLLCSCSGRIELSEEATVKTHAADSEIAEKLSEMLRMLTVNSPILPEFDDIGEVMDNCRDSILYYMLTGNYGKYTGDIEKLDSAVAEYPRMQITNLVPAREFEETVYKSFGGRRKIGNKSGRLFVYLDKVAAYTSVTMVDEDPISVEISELCETEHTYRMYFRCSAGEIVSDKYRAIFVKRDDGTVYFDSVVKNP